MEPDRSLASNERVVVFPNNSQAYAVSGYVVEVRDDGFSVRTEVPFDTPTGRVPAGKTAHVAWSNVASVERAPRDNAELPLWQETMAWTLPLLIRTYETDKRGEQAYAHEATMLANHSYQPTTQSTEGSHLHAGRLLLTGGLSVFAGRGGIRSKGKLTVTFQRVAPQAAALVAGPDPMDQIRKLAELRDAGILSNEEFESKKAEILSRM